MYIEPPPPCFSSPKLRKREKREEQKNHKDIILRKGLQLHVD